MFPWYLLIFLKRSLVFPILFFSSISLHWSVKKAFLSRLVILWNSAFRWFYLSFSPLLFASLLFTAVCKASSDSHFAFLYFFFLGMVLIPVSCTMSRTLSIVHQAFCLKLNIQKMKFMAFGPFTSWEIDGETGETVSDLIFLGSKITADGDCSHEIKIRLLLGRKVMTNLDIILKSRDKSLCQQRSV